MLIKIILHVPHFVFYCSVFSLMLPPIETFKDFPRFQKYYSVFIVIVTRWGSINFRNTLYSKYFDNGALPPSASSTKQGDTK